MHRSHSSSVINLDNSNRSTVPSGHFIPQNLVEIGRQAVWSLSSAKNGNGVQQLLDNNVETFWQSDGLQPHFINIQFHKVMKVKQLSIYCNYKMDESYTPKQISIRIGSSFHDLREVRSIELDEPSGWVDIPLCSPSESGENEEDPSLEASRKQGYERTNMVQIAILSNHQNGRDTHIRQVKVYGPAVSISPSIYDEFSTVEFSQFSCIR
jgi:anaphase-promoting complex subunit 10